MFPLIPRPTSIAEAEVMITALVTRRDRLSESLMERHEVRHQSMRQIGRDMGIGRDVVGRRLAHVRAACRIAELARRGFYASAGPSVREKY